MRKELKKKIRAIGILTLVRSILRGREDREIKESEILTISKNDTISFSWKLDFVDNDIVWLQNLPEKRVREIIEDAKKLIKKYCPEDWE